MRNPENGFEALELLRRQNGKQVQRYRDFEEYLDLRAREKGVPLHGQFELTPLCNFNCKMCYVHLEPEQLGSRTVLSVNAWKDLMRQAWDAGMIDAVLTGGECLIYPGFEELYLYLHGLGCSVSILTNGYLLDEKRLHFFLEHRPKDIRITLYGCDDGVYERVTGQRAFSRVVENIRRAMDAGLRISLSVTPNTFLGEDVLQTVRVGKALNQQLNVNSAIFQPREETGRGSLRGDPEAEMYVKIYLLLNELDGIEIQPVEEEKLPPIGGPAHECTEHGLLCGGGRSSFVIDWKGNVLPCNRLTIVSASALEEGFRAAWARVNQRVNGWPRVPECRGCAYSSVCKKCPAAMLEYAPAGKQPLALCERVKSYVRSGVIPAPDCE